MSIGVKLRSSSEAFSVCYEGNLISPDKFIFPPAVVDLIAPGGAVIGWIHITDSIKSPGEWAVLNPYMPNGTRLPQEIVQLGSVRSVNAFSKLSARCESYISDLT